MTLNIGAVIMAKRKEKAWTQEQLANAVGVSPPAVSKWETGTSYPDITLLSPIARALDTTVDELLSYGNELSIESIDELTKKVLRTYETHGFDKGWSQCQKLTQEYPNSIPLKFHIGSLFQSFMLMKEDFKKEDIHLYYEKAAEIYEEVLASGHPKFTFPSTIILIGYYSMLNKLDRAEELLNGLPKLNVDPDFLYPSIYALRGKNEEAIQMTQENIHRYLPRISQSLSILSSYAYENEDMDSAYAITKTNFEMMNLFGVREELVYPDMIKLLAAQGTIEEALQYFEAYVQSIMDLTYDYSKNPIFNKLKDQHMDLSHIKKILANSILIAGGYDALKNEPRYTDAIRKLQDLVALQTHTFQNFTPPNISD